MKLLSLNLGGRYKGLQDQSFEFSASNGSVLAFIGLNGTGKSQVLELITETFAYLERWQRGDFLTRKNLGYSVSVIYRYSIEKITGDFASYDAIYASERDGCIDIRVSIDDSGNVKTALWINQDWIEFYDNESFPLPVVVGYSSGLNENLQRGFMKNSVQYYDVMRIRQKRRKELSSELDETEIVELNRYYADKYPHIFRHDDVRFIDEDYVESGYLSLTESDTPISRMIYVDYDSSGVLLSSLGVLDKDEIDSFLGEIKYRYPAKIVLQYDLRGGIAEEDAVRDVRMLIDIAGIENVIPVGRRASEQQYELYELEYLAGQIVLDLNNKAVFENLKERNYEDPFSLFRRLYKLQQLGVKNWQGTSRQKLRNDSFQGTVKKPLKTKLPLSVIKLELADADGIVVDFDDLSDGEAQLLQVLASVKVFAPEGALFLLDEPETHLNPSWRTYFHKHLDSVFNSITDSRDASHIFLSTHSPFIVSSLKREDVFNFDRNSEGQIEMKPVSNQTYGASFDVLIKEQFKMKSLISQTVVEDIKDHLPSSNSKKERQEALDWITENVGESMEKAYLIRKLKSDVVSS